MDLESYIDASIFILGPEIRTALSHGHAGTVLEDVSQSKVDQ